MDETDDANNGDDFGGSTNDFSGSEVGAPAGDAQDQYTQPEAPQNEDSITSGWGLGGRGNMGRNDPSLTPSDQDAGLQSEWSIGLQNFLAENGLYTGEPTTKVSDIEPGKDITGPANFGGVGARGGIVDDVGSYLQENPVIDTALSILLGLANPALGIGYNALSNISRGNYGLGLGGLVGLANPGAGRAASMIGNVIDKGPQGAVNSAFSEASRTLGLNPGKDLTDMLGIDPSSRAGIATGIAGNLGAQYGVDQLGQALGPNWSDLAGSGEMQTFASLDDGGSGGDVAASGLDASATSSAGQTFVGGGGGSAGIGDQRKRLRDVIGAYSPASNLSKYLSARQQMLMEQQNG